MCIYIFEKKVFKHTRIWTLHSNTHAYLRKKVERKKKCEFLK